MSEATPSLGTRAASGMIWLASQTVAARVVTIVSQWVLANFLLGPKQFGQIGLVYTITVLATQLTNPGVDDVLLQRQKHIRRWVTPAFWISLSCAIGGAIVMTLAGAIVVAIAQSRGNLAYGNPDNFWMTLILACGAPLNAASLVPNVMLRCELRFARLAAINLFEVTSQQLLIVALAAMGFGTYSFVIPMPLVAGVRLIVLWFLVRPPVRRTLALHRWPALVGSTGWVFGQRMMNTLVSQGDYITLGAIFADDRLVGLYFYAFTLSMQIVRVLCDNLGTVVLPVLTTIQDDSQRLGQAVARAMKALATLIVPIVAVQILLAGPGVRLLFVEKWHPMIPLIQLLGIGLFVMGAGYPLSAMVVASGRFRDNFLIALIGAVLFFAILIPASFLWSAKGTAGGVALWTWVGVVIGSIMSYRSIWGVAVLFSAIWRALASALVASLPVVLLLMLMEPGRLNDILLLVVAPPIVLVIYYFALRWMDGRAVEELVASLVAAIGPMLRRLAGRQQQPA